LGATEVGIEEVVDSEKGRDSAPPPKPTGGELDRAAGGTIGSG